MKVGVSNEVPDMLALARDAHEDGRMDDCRRLLMEALAIAPMDPEARGFAERVFPEVSRSDGAAAIEVKGWSGNAALDGDWGEAVGGEPSNGEPAVFEMEPPEGLSLEEGREEPAAPLEEEAPLESSSPESESDSPSPGGSGWAMDSDWAESFDPEPRDAGPLGESPGVADASAATGTEAGPAGPPPAPGLELLCAPAAKSDVLDAGDEEAPAGEGASVAGDEGDVGEGQDSSEAEETDDRDEEVASLLEGAEELFELADFSGSLELVEKALEIRPDDPRALEYLSKNQETLIQMYESKLGPMERRPRLAIAPEEVVWLNLDHRAGYVLSQIDGTVSIDDLYALSGMGRLDTSRILAQLIEEGVVSFD